MINRVIYGGKEEVFYKVGDLADLFELSVYKFKKILKKQNIETTPLTGFGRSLFISEKNVSAIEVDGEVTLIETVIETQIVKPEKKTLEKVTVKEVKKRGRKVKKKKSTDVLNSPKEEKVATDPATEKLQSEHKALISLSNQYGVKFLKAGKMPTVHEIVEKHFKEGHKFKESTLDEIDKMRSTIGELTAAVAILDTPQPVME